MTSKDAHGSPWENARGLLNGKVTIAKLPYYESPPGNAPAPPMKRIALPQGELAQFWDSPDGMRYIAAIEIVPDTIRGNHLHREKLEVIYILSGRVLLAVEDPQSGEQASAELEPGNLIRVLPGTIHALKGLASGFAIECSPGRYDSQDVEKLTVTL
jgi:mannose-6-phosphate isomerase-like protein (cupin superfamily)